MEECKNCSICLNSCPTGAIRKENFVIDVGKCISLYNEMDSDFPDWIPIDAHNALTGCMKCQFSCPGNKDVINKTLQLGTVTENETKAILNGTPSVELLENLTEKLNGFIPVTSEEHFHMFTRNLSVLLET